MIFLKLFIIFTKIGTFNFGGSCYVLSLIHNEVVVKNQWLSNAEFTGHCGYKPVHSGSYRHQCSYIRRLHGGA